MRWRVEVRGARSASQGWTGQRLRPRSSGMRSSHTLHTHTSHTCSLHTHLTHTTHIHSLHTHLTHVTYYTHTHTHCICTTHTMHLTHTHLTDEPHTNTTDTQHTSCCCCSVTKSCPLLCDPMDRSTLGLPVLHCLLELVQVHVHQVGDAIQPSHPLSSPSPPAPNPSQHQTLFQ